MGVLCLRTAWAAQEGDLNHLDKNGDPMFGNERNGIISCYYVNNTKVHPTFCARRKYFPGQRPGDLMRNGEFGGPCKDNCFHVTKQTLKTWSANKILHRILSL